MKKQDALLLLIVGLLMSVGLVGCDGTPAPPSGGGSAPPASGGLQFDLRRETPVVSTGASPPLSPVTVSGFQPLLDGHLVDTDSTGEALLQAGTSAGTCKIFLFQDGGLLKRGCPGSTFAGSNTTCVEEGSAAYSECSDHVIMTPSGQAQVVGSWVSATYLPEMALTLVVVLEGNVMAQAVLEMDSRELGDPVPIDGREFWYTVPDAMLGRVGEVAGLPMREPLPLEALPPLIDELGIWPWMERVAVRAEEDGVPFIERLEPPAAESRVILQGGGGALDDGAVQEALVMAVPWTDITRQTFPEEAVAVAVQMTEVQIDDARSVDVNPDASRELMAEAGYPNGFGLLLMFPTSDEQLAVMAKQMTAYLAEIGIDPQLADVPASEAEVMYRTQVAAGEPVVWLHRPSRPSGGLPNTTIDLSDAVLEAAPLRPPTPTPIVVQ